MSRDNKIIIFPVSPEAEARLRKYNSEIRRQNGQQPDRFERSEAPKKEQRGYTIGELTELIGYEKADEIFSKFETLASDTFVSAPDKETPIFQTLREIWDGSKDATISRRRKARQLERMSSAFKEYEKACSVEHKKRYGEDVDIRIKISNGEEEAFLTDILDKQAKFFRKSKLSASLDVIGQKMDYGLECIIDSMTIK